MTGNLTAKTPQLLLNLLTFQAGWFACVLGAAHGRPLFGVLTVAAIAVIWLIAAPRPLALAQLLALSALVGFCWDSWLSVFGLVSYPPGPLTPFAPLWIVAMWLLLATTLHLSMRWLQERWLWAAALGAVAAPLSYLAGARLGALNLLQVQPALLAQSLGWALLLPALLRLARRLNV